MKIYSGKPLSYLEKKRNGTAISSLPEPFFFIVYGGVYEIK